MRKSIILSLVCLISLGAFAQKQKIGHVNTQQIMQSLFVKDSIQTKYMAFQTMLQGELQKIQTDLVTREQELAHKQATMEKSLFDIQAQALRSGTNETTILRWYLVVLLGRVYCFLKFGRHTSLYFEYYVFISEIVGVP